LPPPFPITNHRFRWALGIFVMVGSLLAIGMVGISAKMPSAQEPAGGWVAYMEKQFTAATAEREALRARVERIEAARQERIDASRLPDRGDQ